MATGSDLDPDVIQAIGYRQGASDRPCRSIEGRQEAVTRCVDLPTSEPIELASYEVMVGGD